MITKSVVALLSLTAAIMFSGVNEASCEVSVRVGTPNLSFSFSDYQPPPPNVYIYNDRGRPYYVERDRRVYMEKRHHGKQYKKYDKHNKHDNRDNHDRRNH